MTDPVVHIDPATVQYLRAARHRSLAQALTGAADDIDVALTKVAAKRLLTSGELLGIANRIAAAAAVAAEISAFDSLIPRRTDRPEADHDPDPRS